MKSLPTLLIMAALAGGGLALTTTAVAAQHGGHGMHMKGMGSGMHQGGWRATLSDDQIKQIDKLKLEHKKKTYPLNTGIKQARVELAMLITSDKPDQKAINSKIDEIVKLKAEKMRLKASHKVAVRKVLNEDQRVLFDMHVLKKAYHGKSGHHRGHH